MSADRYAVCPRCKKSHDALVEERRLEVEKSYGTISVDMFDRLRAEFETLKATIDLERTLREDYEQGMNSTGLWECTYSCSCKVCGFQFKTAASVQAKGI